MINSIQIKTKAAQPVYIYFLSPPDRSQRNLNLEFRQIKIYLFVFTQHLHKDWWSVFGSLCCDLPKSTSQNDPE